MLNPRQRAVLGALVRGPVAPGELGDRLELPAAAVTGHIDTLRDHGFEIERGPDGFELQSVPEYGYGVQADLEAPFVIDYTPEVSSTNERARELAESAETDVAVLAETQTAGRGRYDRVWTSPPGGIYCSVLLRPTLPPEESGVLNLAAALAAADAAAEVSVEVGCKWPNDVLGPDGDKLGGVLAESATRDGAVEWLVIGLGLNVNLDPAELPPEATSLSALAGSPIDRRVVTQTYLETFDRWRRDRDGIVPAWRRRSTTLGQEVWLSTGGEEFVGEATDIDDSGRLVVKTAAGRRRIGAGECEHLRPM
jgi:BirA family biotin operon repressor/biotin-[acetyl-CoA-carboxylase] ligase